jgi:lipopolysaccharide export system permease protein
VLRRIPIVDRYVTREILGPLAMSLVIVTFALVAARLLKLVDLVVNQGVNPGDILRLIGFILPQLLELTFPMAIMLGVLLGFGRMSGDQELTAARACGISLVRLSLPVFALAIVVFPIVAVIAFKLRPWANTSLRAEFHRLAQTSAGAALKEKVFNRNIPGMILYVDTIVPPGNTLNGVMISDHRDPQHQSTIIARRGVLVSDEKKQTLTLRLLDGSLFGVEPERNATRVNSFDLYDVAIEPLQLLGAHKEDAETMTYTRLLSAIDSARRAGRPDHVAEVELARKYSVPIGTMIFAVLGVPLGLKPARGGQSERFGISLSLFFCYYLLLRGFQALAEDGKLDANLAMNLPNLAFATLAAILFFRSATDRGDLSRGPIDMMWSWIEQLRARYRSQS